MSNRRQASASILVTVAELAWLAAFGLLIAYRSKVSENVGLRYKIAKIQGAETNINQLIVEREAAQHLVAKLSAESDALHQALGGRTPSAAVNVLKAAEDTEVRLRKADANIQELSKELSRERIMHLETQNRLRTQTTTLDEMQKQLQTLPANAQDIFQIYREALLQLQSAGKEISSLSNRITELELGEISIRRELIGLPQKDLRRVVFIVDTSSSMRNSPAWQEARSIMRMWIEYLSVEECALVNFNDRASIFPTEGYHRVRDTSGRVQPNQKAALLAAFDRSASGTYSDLLKGLRLAYSRSNTDLIVLLTDGHPHLATQSDKAYAQAILRETSMHPSIPILAVAVGSYEVEGAGGPSERRNAAISFLKSLARSTKEGSFLGR